MGYSTSPPSHGDTETPPTAGTHFSTRQMIPKANDPHKRDMTFDEKQNLSTNLQNLRSEKLEYVVQILKKRNPDLNRQDEVIVDMDSLDSETLWELDRFVIKDRTFEIAKQARVAAAKTAFATVTMRSDSMTMPSRTRPRHGDMDTPQTVPANDPHKRDMTCEEKQNLSNNLQNLRSEQLGSVVRIIKKRNPILDHDDIEIDLDTLDSETLWELDRCVMMSKYKRMKIDNQARVAAAKTVFATNPAPPATEDPPGDMNAALALVRGRIGDNSSPSSSSTTSHPGSSSTGNA